MFAHTGFTYHAVSIHQTRAVLLWFAMVAAAPPCHSASASVACILVDVFSAKTLFEARLSGSVLDAYPRYAPLERGRGVHRMRREGVAATGG